MINIRHISLFHNYQLLCRCSFNFYYHKRHIFSRISDVFKENDHLSFKTIKGWVKGVRKLKHLIFFDINDGSCIKSLQVVVNKSDVKNPASYGSSVVASGNLSLNASQNLELVAKSFEIIGSCDVEEFPFRPKKTYTNETIRQYLHFRFRTNRFSSLIRIRHQVIHSLHDYFIKNGFINVNTPILTSNDCEGAGDVFHVVTDKELGSKGSGTSKLQNEELFFNDEVYLTVSGQLHLEAAARAMGEVYTFGPTFRAENSKSRLHLTEFYMLEAESPFIHSIEGITSVVEELIKHMTEQTLNVAGEEVYLCRKLFSETQDLITIPLEELISQKFTIMSYDEAAQIILKNLDKFQTSFAINDAFSKEQELFLVKYNSLKPIFVVNWPSDLKPFYMKRLPGGQAAAFDLLCPIVGELCGGSLREDGFDKLQSELIKRELNEKLNWYLDLRKFGNVPTGGFGLGFERYLQVLLGISNIKDTIPFPRWPHNCKM